MHALFPEVQTLCPFSARMFPTTVRFPWKVEVELIPLTLMNPPKVDVAATPFTLMTDPKVDDADVWMFPTMSRVCWGLFVPIPTRPLPSILKTSVSPDPD